MSERVVGLNSQVPDQQPTLLHKQEDEFFNGLTLQKIYGSEEWSGQSWSITEGYKDDVHPKIPILAYWFPYVMERKFIRDLAMSVAGDGKSPTLLEVGCGSGFVSKLLAAGGDITVIGVDNNLEDMESNHVPQTAGDVRLINSDVWDVLEEFGPTFDEETLAERRELLKITRLDTEYPNYKVSDEPIGDWIWQSGDETLLNNEVENLQEITQKASRPSPVDVVLCSFMHQDLDLTIPIRDGISPKAIIYVRPVSGMAGAGDYYIPAVYDSTIDDLNTAGPNVLTSYNPGINYRTVARWGTHFRSDWYEFLDPPKFIEQLGAEVVVQLRSDVLLGAADPVTQECKYNFDAEFERSFRRITDSVDGFKQGISGAMQIIPSKS